ncbi:hypothetical protein HNR77_004559 [Paenibacillus sp. JGP012]|uniref:DUF5381 family protein n=1 Tax=Paenibacillus sp. JGP012 TaxID=2735914 RepID=UPI00161E60D3|nr:DUF5381 family protein [Paenibacillus sp. JGP012]MBB6023459.1 hypothetical protein [Paenibacillus sp. JGP012]
MQYVTYQRKFAIRHTLICALFIIAGFVLIGDVIFGENSPLFIFYFSSAAFLSFWFVGRLFVWNIRRVFGSNVLFGFDESGLITKSGEHLPWKEIQTIQLAAPGINKWIQPTPSHYDLKMYDGQHHKLYTYSLLKHQENDILKLLRKTWNERKSPSKNQ